MPLTETKRYRSFGISACALPVALFLLVPHAAADAGGEEIAPGENALELELAFSREAD